MKKGRGTPLTKSEQMRRVKGADTRVEMIIRRALWRDGLRYRLNSPAVGKPDLVFSKYKIAIFIDGCFWHKCPLHYTCPKSNPDFWKRKIDRTVSRDEHVNLQLRGEGWLVVRFWEHEVENDLSGCVKTIKDLLAQRG